MGNKKTTKKSNFELLTDAQEWLLKKFTESLKDRKNSQDLLPSRNQYGHVINALSVDDAFKTSKTKNFMELLLKLLATESVNKKDKIENIVTALKKSVNDKTNYDWNANGKKSYKTYINKFIKFLENSIKDADWRKEYKDKWKSLKMDAAASAALEEIEGELYLHNILFTKFKSRLRCQDRTSGQKIWLPLRFIAKLYSKTVNGNQKIDSSFSKWLDSLVNSICIHYEDNGIIKHVKFGDKEDISLILRTNDNGKYDVYVGWGYNMKNGIVEYQVWTPTGMGNEKVPMVVEKISDIAIDHVKPIDQTLKEKADELKELEKVSKYYKELIEEEKEPTNEAAKTLVKKINLSSLILDLNKISDDSPLRLMSSEYNSNKSNGDTFKRIIKDTKGQYFGILLEGIKGDNKKNKDKEHFCLYQKLAENGVMRIRHIRYKKDEIKGDKVESKDYFGIIDLI